MTVQNTQVALYVEDGIGGFLGDLVFVGGRIGALAGNVAAAAQLYIRERRDGNPHLRRWPEHTGRQWFGQHCRAVLGLWQCFQCHISQKPVLVLVLVFVRLPSPQRRAAPGRHHATQHESWQLQRQVGLFRAMPRCGIDVTSDQGLVSIPRERRLLSG